MRDMDNYLANFRLLGSFRLQLRDAVCLWRPIYTRRRQPLTAGVVDVERDGAVATHAVSSGDDTDVEAGVTKRHSG